MSETNRTSIHNCQVAESQIAELESQLAYEQERNANNVANDELQIAELKAQVARLTEAADWDILNALDEVQDYKEQIAAVTEQLAELQAEITRLRAGGCARDQHTTQYCGEMQSLIARLTALAEEFQTEETWDGKRNDALRYCAGRLREAIGGGEEVKWTH